MPEAGGTSARLSLRTSHQSLFGSIARPAVLVPAVGIAGLLVFAEIAVRNLNGPNLADLAAVFVASTLSSIAGFAFSAICGAMLFHLLPRPVDIVQIMIVCSIAI